MSKKISDLLIDLTGAFKSNIDGNIMFVCSGQFLNSTPPHDTANAFVFNIMDMNKGTISELVLAIFVEKNNIVEFRYRHLVFEVISTSFERIELRKDSADYFIERTNLI